MTDQHKDLYAASCNPARRAKQSHTDDAAQNPSKKPNPTTADVSHPPRNVLPILPKRSAPEALQETNSTASATQPARAKRGRKPGPLSRTARDTQRKLNHSIIEKARRTKINEALATLRELVPKDYGSSKDKAVDDDDGEENEGRQSKSKSRATGKREEKEKEFKLEILVRTVSFMQDLLARVKEMEADAQPCSKCVAREPSKRKREVTDDGTNDNEEDLDRHLPKRVNHSRDAQSAADSPVGQRSSSIESTASRAAYLGSRLPSISSWLPPSQIDPALLSPNQRPMSNNTYQLPSPPSSTIFYPIQTPHIPPALTLGPVATSSLLSPLRTPEDESAASLLLQISASSPQLLPSSISNSCTSFDLSKLRTACTTPGKPVEYVQAQTPGTMLGLMQKMRG
jgi:Helix-loop-helix DNA-binding domain